jgi:peptide/nickel transport system permease protein
VADASALVLAADDGRRVAARGFWRGVVRGLLHDRVAIASALLIALVLLLAFAVAPLAAHLLGHGPNTLNENAGNPLTGHPAGVWTWVPRDPIYMPHGSLYILGADSAIGRDTFLRLLYGGQVSLEVALIATALSVTFGTLVGLVAGFFEGWIGALASWLTELVMVFPFLLFGIALWTTIGPDLLLITLHGVLPPGVFLLSLVIAAFSWFYPMRITRIHVLSLREREFVEAARMIGSSELRILRSHLLPHLLGPMLTYGTLVMANALVAEVGLSWLGLRVPLPTASWAGMLADAPNTYGANPYLAFFPAGAVVLTVVALNLLGESLRGAVDPRR